MTQIHVEQYNAEEGVPIPVAINSSIIPIRELEVGQSILFPRERRAYVQSKASRLKRNEDKEYTVRAVNSKHCRVWRTK